MINRYPVENTLTPIPIFMGIGMPEFIEKLRELASIYTIAKKNAKNKKTTINNQVIQQSTIK